MATQIAQQIHAGAVDEIKTGGCRVVTGGGHAIAVIYHDGQVLSCKSTLTMIGQVIRWAGLMPSKSASVLSTCSRLSGFIRR